MPIYEYHCKKCGHVFETMQKVSDPAPPGCPQCESADISRLVSATSFKLKGTGWYATDFKDKAKDPAQTKPEESKESEVSKEPKASKKDDNETKKSKSTSSNKDNKTSSE